MFPAPSGHRPPRDTRTGPDRPFLGDPPHHLSIQRPDVPGGSGPARCVKLSPHIRLPPGAHRDYYLTLAFPASASPEDYRLGSSSVLLQLQTWGAWSPRLVRGAVFSRTR